MTIDDRGTPGTDDTQATLSDLPSPAPASPAGRRGGGPGVAVPARWIAALGVVAVAVAVIIGAILVLGGRQTPEALRYIPADAMVVGELRMDLPGDQLQRVGNLLAHFPGFRDQSILSDKIDEALDRVVGSATSGAKTYRTDLKPWLGGALFAAVRPNTAGGSGSAASEPYGYLLSATTNGAVDCSTALGEAAGATQTYREVQLFTAGDPSTACFVQGRQVVMGDTASVRAALDAKADGTSVAGTPAYGSARDALAGDRVATVFISTDGLERLGAVPSTGLGLTVPSLPPDVRLPAWEMIGVRAEDDALVVDAVTAPVPEGASAGPSFLPVPPAHESRLASQVPGTAIAYLEVQGAGALAQNALAALAADPATREPVAQLRQAMNALGGASQLVGWVGDAGVYVGATGTQPIGAVLLEATTDADATAHAAQLEGIAKLAAGSAGATVRESSVEGVRVLSVRLAGTSEIPGAPVQEVSLAVRGRIVLLGLGEASIGDVLRVTAENSLARSAAYAHAMDRGLGPSSVVGFVNVPAAVRLAEAVAPADGLATWRTEVRPYVDPIETVSFTGSSTGSGARTRLVITVTQPASSPAPSQSQP